MTKRLALDIPTQIVACVISGFIWLRRSSSVSGKGAFIKALGVAGGLGVDGCVFVRKLFSSDPLCVANTFVEPRPRCGKERVCCLLKLRRLNPTPEERLAPLTNMAPLDVDLAIIHRPFIDQSLSGPSPE